MPAQRRMVDVIPRYTVPLLTVAPFQHEEWQYFPGCPLAVRPEIAAYLTDSGVARVLSDSEAAKRHVFSVHADSKRFFHERARASDARRTRRR